MKEYSDITLKKIINEPMDNYDLKKYLGSTAKILRYEELKNYDRLTQLLPHSNDFVVLLYERKIGEGHWCCLLRYGNTFEFWDSYGTPPDGALKWNSEEENSMVGADQPYLTNLFNKAKMSGYDVVYNKKNYQELAPNVNTCGAFVVFRIMTFIHDRLKLKQFTKLMEFLKRDTGKNYDEIVAQEISIR